MPVVQDSTEQVRLWWCKLSWLRVTETVRLELDSILCVVLSDQRLSGLGVCRSWMMKSRLGNFFTRLIPTRPLPPPTSMTVPVPKESHSNPWTYRLNVGHGMQQSGFYSCNSFSILPPRAIHLDDADDTNCRCKNNTGPDYSRGKKV